MHKLLHELEKIIDKIIPFLVIILAALIIIEFTTDVSKYEPWISIADSFIIAFFVTDLIFKWLAIRKVGKFIKTCWIDILAVFPFYLIFRAYIGFAGLLKAEETIAEAQKIAHEAVLIKEARLAREVEAVAKEAEVVAKEARLARVGFAARIFRAVPRFFRIVSARLHIAHHRLVSASQKHKKKRK